MQAGISVNHLASAIGLPSEDAALVAELQAGSEVAFARLIDRYQQPLYSLIARSLQDPADASDITQEVFIKVFRNIGGFHGDASLGTWLYRIAVHEASNQRRWWSRHKRQEITIDAPLGCDADGGGESLSLGATLADGGCSPFEHAAQKEVRERVEAALRQVPEAFRTVVVLREIEGFAYEEIADILQVNLGTVKSRLTRGRVAMRALLAPGDMIPLNPGAPAEHVAPHASAGVVVHVAHVAADERQGLQPDENRHRAHAASVRSSGLGSGLEVSQ